jgi:membrane associated rhomboid family serine protease
MVMPLWDDSPLKLPRLPLVTWGLIAANIAVFIFQLMTPQPEYLSFAFGVTPANIASVPVTKMPVPPYVTLITYQFLHADVLYLLGNMVFLGIFGDDVEEAMGSLRFIGFYLACGIAAGLAFTASAPHSMLPLIGASGAIAGVLAAYLMFRPCQKVLVFVPYFIVWFVLRPITRLDAMWVLGGWALIQLWHISVQSQDNVAYMAHVGGFTAGAVLFPLLRYRTVRLFECMREPAAT